GFDKPFIRGFDAPPQGDRSRPAQGIHGANVQELSRSAVRLFRVENEAALPPNDARDERGKLRDGNVLAAAYVEHAPAGLVLGGETDRVGAIVYVQKFSSRRAGTPQGDLVAAASLRVVNLVHQCR